MDERDTEILFGYLERLTKAVEKIAEEIEIHNSYQVTCSDDYTHMASFSFEGNEETK